jgi:hypothetical protein
VEVVIHPDSTGPFDLPLAVRTSHPASPAVSLRLCGLGS